MFLHPHAKNKNLPSVRVNCMLPAQYLSLKGHETSVVETVYELEAKNPDIAVVMSAYQTEDVLSLKRKLPYLKVVLFQSDGPVTTDECMDAVNAIVTDSEPLLETIPARCLYKTVSIPDTLEVKRGRPPHTRLNRPLKLVWVGTGGNYFFAGDVIRSLRTVGWWVETICDGINATVPWDLYTVDTNISVCDVGIVPYPEDLVIDDTRTYNRFRYKDNSRMVLLQALGLPVVVSPLPAHLLYAKHNETALFANSAKQWLDCVQYLQGNPNCYNAIAEDGYKQAWEYAAPEVTGAQWEAVMVRACQPRALRVV